MKISELKEILKNSRAIEDNQAYKDEEVVIVIRNTVPTLGACPCVPVESVGFGFDWDDNRLLLHPKEELTKYKTADSLSPLSIAFVREVSQERTAKGRLTKLAKKAQAILESI